MLGPIWHRPTTTQATDFGQPDEQARKSAGLTQMHLLATVMSVSQQMIDVLRTPGQFPAADFIRKAAPGAQCVGGCAARAHEASKMAASPARRRIWKRRAALRQLPRDKQNWCSNSLRRCCGIRSIPKRQPPEFFLLACTDLGPGRGGAPAPPAPALIHLYK